MAFSFCRLFLSFHAPSEFMSLFFTARINKEGGIKKSFGRQKCWGQRSRPALFFRDKGRRPELFRIHPPK